MTWTPPRFVFFLKTSKNIKIFTLSLNNNGHTSLKREPCIKPMYTKNGFKTFKCYSAQENKSHLMIWKDQPDSLHTFVLIESSSFLCCHYSCAVQAQPGPRVTWPPGCKCVSLLCGAGFLTLCCLLTRSKYNNCWIRDPWRAHVRVSEAGPVKSSCITPFQREVGDHVLYMLLIHVKDQVVGSICGASHTNTSWMV